MAWAKFLRAVVPVILCLNLVGDGVNGSFGDWRDAQSSQDLEVAETLAKAYHSGALDEGYHQEGAKNHYESHHGETSGGHGHRDDYLERDHLKKGKGGHQYHDHGSHHKEAGQAVGHYDSKAKKEHDKLLKHTWDRGGGFVKKWNWDKGSHLEEEHLDAQKKHLAHHGQSHHQEAGKKSKGQKADHQHHQEAHKKEHHKASHGGEKKLEHGQFKEESHHQKGSKRKHHHEHDDGHHGWSGGIGGYRGGGGYGGHHGWSSPVYSKSGLSHIKRYLRPNHGMDDYGLEGFASNNRYSISKDSPFNHHYGVGHQKSKSTLMASIYPKNWKYGHIFGHGLGFLLARSEY